MKSASPSSPLSMVVQIGSCVAACLAVGLAGPAGVAYADAYVRASSRAPSIAVLTRTEDFQRVDFAADGVHFETLLADPSMSINDIAVLADGTLLVARHDLDRPSIAKVMRVAKGRHREQTLVGFPTDSDAHFATGGEGRVALVSAGGAFRSDDSGRTWRRAGTWKADPYGFYAASLSLDRAGRIDALVPEFNTCGSTDRLEDLTRHELDPHGVASRAALSNEEMSDISAATVGRHGFLYSTARLDEGCGLRVHEGAARRMLDHIGGGPADFCFVTGRNNGRFTLLLFNSRLLRANGASLKYLGDSGDDVADVYPDNRGRALVLHDDGSLTRHASASPVSLVRPPS